MYLASACIYLFMSMFNEHLLYARYNAGVSKKNMKIAQLVWLSG